MLTLELKKLKEKLEGNKIDINEKKLLEELKILDSDRLQSLNESLAISSSICRACGRKL